MKKIIILINVFLGVAYSASFTEDLNTANTLYEQNKQEEAKNYYIKASKNGSAEAHFKLAYQYITKKEESIYHYSEAAKLGHPEALHYALEALFFRGNDLVLANPRKALEVYNNVKKNNSKITIYNEENYIKILKMASEVPLLDGEEFIKRYQLEKDEGFSDDSYYIWKLAEKASRGERFKNPSSELVLQLIIKGGSVPAEVESAVSDYYNIWKNGKEIVEFDICNYVTSTYGMSMCAARQEKRENDKIEKKLSSILKDLKLNNKELLYSSYDITSQYLKTKVWSEEGHDGSGYAVWAIGSLLKQKNKYLEFMKKIADGFVPECKGSLAENDILLNKRYGEIKEKLKKTPLRGMHMSITEEDFEKVQRLWIPYRDTNAKLYASISKQKEINFWKNYFTIQRMKAYDLLEILIEDYK